MPGYSRGETSRARGSFAAPFTTHGTPTLIAREDLSGYFLFLPTHHPHPFVVWGTETGLTVTVLGRVTTPR